MDKKSRLSADRVNERALMSEIFVALRILHPSTSMWFVEVDHWTKRVVRERSERKNLDFEVRSPQNLGEKHTKN